VAGFRPVVDLAQTPTRFTRSWFRSTPLRRSVSRPARSPLFFRPEAYTASFPATHLMFPVLGPDSSHSTKPTHNLPHLSPSLLVPRVLSPRTTHFLCIIPPCLTPQRLPYSAFPLLHTSHSKHCCILLGTHQSNRINTNDQARPIDLTAPGCLLCVISVFTTPHKQSQTTLPTQPHFKHQIARLPPAPSIA
jgi:hypothetical protein